MKIEVPVQLEINTIAGNFGTRQAGIADDSMPFLFEMMSKNLYSNPIGSIVRELTSNCFDSHIEAGTDDAVIVGIKKDEEGTYMSFQDFGVGLSEHRINNVYMNYFSSTKRKTNDQIGGFGLGSKTPLAYTDYFYIETISDEKTVLYHKQRKAPYIIDIEIRKFKQVSTKYLYLYSKGETIPTLDIINKEHTTERNGTEVKVYFRDYLDEKRFEEECKKQLCYFDNVYFIGISIENNYHIFDKELYKYRTKNSFEEMHICYGKVTYPINWKELGISPIKVPIGIKFKIGELPVTPNREALRYEPHIKDLVNDRIHSVTKDLKDEFAANSEPIEDFLEWLDEDNTRAHIVFTLPDGNPHKLYLTGLGLKDTIKLKAFHDLGINLPNDLSYFHNYQVEGIFINSRFQNSSPTFTGLIERKETFIITTHRVDLKNDRVKLAYIGKIYGHLGNFYIVKEENFRYSTVQKELGLNLKGYYSTFGDPNYKEVFPLGKAKKLYGFHKVVKDYVNKNRIGEKYDDIIVPEEFKKEFRKAEYESTEAFIRKSEKKFIAQSMIYRNSFTWSKKEASNHKGIIIYGSSKDMDLLLKSIIFLKQRKNCRNKEGDLKKYIKVIKIAETNFKFLNKMQNAFHIKELYSDNRIFRQICTSFRIEEMLMNLVKVQEIGVDSFIEEISKICSPIGEYMNELLQYRDTNTYTESRHNDYSRSMIKNEFLQIAIKHNYFDNSILYKIEAVENWFKDIEILKFTRINDESLPHILKYLKDKNKKLNFEYYSNIIHKQEIEEGQLIINFDVQPDIAIINFKKVA